MFQRMRMKLLLLLLNFCALSASGQNPKVHFNHFYLVIDSSDLNAIKHSDFIKNEFAAFTTRTTHADNGDVWTGSYLFGPDNYFEIFDSSGEGEPTGYAGMGLSVDSTGEINTLDSALKKKYQIALS